MAYLNDIFYDSKIILLFVLIIFLILEIIIFSRLWLRRSPKWLADQGYKFNKFLIKREISKAFNEQDAEKIEDALFKTTLNKLSSPDINRKDLALAELRYYGKKLSKKNKELMIEYLIDVYKIEDDEIFKSKIIMTICRLSKEKQEFI
jgi:hypothetical protein